MGPPKKGKANKLARMSDEERARYLQHRAAIEEEAKRRKEQLISTFMKNKLKKEEVFSRLNVAKINQQWRQTLRGLKCVELKQDMEALRDWFNEIAEKKNELINELLHDLKESESQYARIHQCHMETIDNLLEIYQQRISVFQKGFQEEKEELLKAARSIMGDMNVSSVQQEEHLKAVVYQQEKAHEATRNMAVSLHSTRVDELTNNMLTELENLVNDKDGKMTILWGNLETVLQNHWAQTEHRRREYLNLKHADTQNCQQIFQYHQQINQLTETLEGLKKQMDKENNDVDEKVADKRLEKDGCLELFQVLRIKLHEEKEADRKKLCYFTNSANSTTKKLEDTLSKGQQIMQLMTLCRKYETEDDQIGTDDTSTLPLTDLDDLERFQGCSSRNEEPLAVDAVRKFSKMDGFWRRYNKVYIEKEVLAIQHQKLLEEQKQLKYVLKQCFKRYSSSQSLPKVPLTIHRPISTGPRRTGIRLHGEKVVAKNGKFSACSAPVHSPPAFIHMLTIELTKPEFT